MSSTFINTETRYRSHEYYCQHYTVCNKSDEDHHIFECKCDIIDGYSTTMIPIEYMIDMEYIVEELVHALCGKCKYRNEERS